MMVSSGRGLLMMLAAPSRIHYITIKYIQSIAHTGTGAIIVNSHPSAHLPGRARQAILPGSGYELQISEINIEQ